MAVAWQVGAKLGRGGSSGSCVRSRRSGTRLLCTWQGRTVGVGVRLGLIRCVKTRLSGRVKTRLTVDRQVWAGQSRPRWEGTGGTPEGTRAVRRPPDLRVLVGGDVVDPRVINPVRAGRRCYGPGVERLQAGMMSSDVVYEVQNTHDSIPRTTDVR